ncbi:glutaredoxin family protein [Virgibacillus sp. JSM 102003]|uniref:glutaredoxin family protein n=1 Tax=Virgibacillus sp. JSM 102003 TaxID=1562108 RepID=UPI0035C07F56
MNDKEVIVYISDNCPICEKLLTQLDELDVHYTTRNITKDREYIKHIHECDVFGTPATFVGDEVVCGFQINKIKYLLDMSCNYQPHL